jgi:hypothetical protein
VVATVIEDQVNGSVYGCGGSLALAHPGDQIFFYFCRKGAELKNRRAQERKRARHGDALRREKALLSRQCLQGGRLPLPGELIKQRGGLSFLT